MKNSKLIRILKQLNSRELEDFHDFVRSPFFNKNKKCIALYEFLLPYAPDFSNMEMDDIRFTKTVYLNKRSLSTTIEKLLRLLEKYLIQYRFEQQNELKYYYLLEELRERNEQKHYDLLYKQANKKIAAKTTDKAVLFGAYLLEVSQLEIHYQRRTSPEKKAIQLQKTIQAFDTYFISNHIWLNNAVLSNLELGTDVIQVISKEMVEYAQALYPVALKDAYKENPLIQLQLLLRNLLESGKENDFQILFDKLKESHPLISKAENQHFYKFLANYCIERIYQGENNYYKELLAVYIFAMDIDALIEEKYLTPFRMKNIIIVSAKSNQIELAHSLMDEYLPSINPIYQEVTAAYCRGYLYFIAKQYHTAIDYLRQCSNMRSLFDLDAQSILYKIYYETNEDWAFEIPVQSFSVRLSRHKDKYPKSTIEGYINFFRILRQIYRKKEDPNYKKTKEDILTRINKMKFLSDKSWLKEKLNELKD